MQAYNVEIFDQAFNLIQHSNINDVSYAIDYLSPVENTIMVQFDSRIANRDYIHIVNDDRDFFGVIFGIDTADMPPGWIQVRYKPFTSLFDAPIMFDTNLQGSGTALETVIANFIRDYWMSNSDAVQNIPGLSVSTISSTTSWGFNLKSDVEGLHRCIINFQSAIIIRAMSKYRVGLYVKPDFQEKTINVEVGVLNSDTFYIESELPNVFVQNIVIQENVFDINKLVVYSQANMTSTITYYLHPDGTYNTTNSNRVTPVLFNTVSVSVDNTTFADAAASAAAEAFGSGNYNNLIELTMLNDDALIDPNSLQIGQLVSIISNGVSYPSILTGFEIGNVTKLIFGTVRIDLTKVLKGA